MNDNFFPTGFVTHDGYVVLNGTLIKIKGMYDLVDSLHKYEGTGPLDFEQELEQLETKELFPKLVKNNDAT